MWWLELFVCLTKTTNNSGYSIVNRDTIKLPLGINSHRYRKRMTKVCLAARHYICYNGKRVNWSRAIKVQFNSFIFILLFLPITVLLYFLGNKINDKVGKIILVIVGLFFYAYSSWKALLIKIRSAFHLEYA